MPVDGAAANGDSRVAKEPVQDGCDALADRPRNYRAGDSAPPAHANASANGARLLPAGPITAAYGISLYPDDPLFPVCNGCDSSFALLICGSTRRSGWMGWN